MAQILGTTKQALSRYERDERSPKLPAAAHFAQALGITLEQLAGISPLDESIAVSIPPADTSVQLSSNERRLIDAYRSLNGQGRDLLLTTAQSYAANPALQKDVAEKAI